MDLWAFRDLWKLEDLLPVPEFVTNERHKLRITYDKQIQDVRWEKHVPRQIRKIKMVYDESVDYSYKYDNRTALNDLYERRVDADEILIIKNGMVSDTFYCNVAFFNGQDWFTPTTNLLPGTQRSFLLDTGIVKETEISEKDIMKYTHIRLFNALTDWDNAPELEIGMIV
jgi:4-amino-4-deoxychorismate lyase